MLFDDTFGQQRQERRTEPDGFFTLRSYDDISNTNGPTFKSECQTLQNWCGAKVVSARNCKSDSSSLGSPSPINATANQYISVSEDQTTRMLSDDNHYKEFPAQLCDCQQLPDLLEKLAQMQAFAT
jgi:hypothetical protein